MATTYGRLVPHLDLDALRGKLIVIEGADGSGRSTQINLLKDWLESRGFAVEAFGLRRSELVSAETLRSIWPTKTPRRVPASRPRLTAFLSELL